MTANIHFVLVCLVLAATGSSSLAQTLPPNITVGQLSQPNLNVFCEIVSVKCQDRIDDKIYKILPDTLIKVNSSGLFEATVEIPKLSAVTTTYLRIKTSQYVTAKDRKPVSVVQATLQPIINGQPKGDATTLVMHPVENEPLEWDILISNNQLKPNMVYYVTIGSETKDFSVKLTHLKILTKP